MRSREIKALLRFIGLLLLAEGGLMLLCLIPALHFHDHTHEAILASGLFTAAVGGLLYVSFSHRWQIEDNRLSFLLVVIIWPILSLFGVLPFLATGYLHSFTDAYFEAMSGFTTTGASIFADVQHLPSSLLLWRSMSQWIGGFGIILVVLALMPRMGINKFSLYTASASIEDPTSHQLSDSSMTLRRMVAIYLMLTALFIWIFHSSGLHIWDAVNLTLTNISSGGFSIYNDGIASLTAHQQYMVALAMLASGVNFTMIYLFITFRWNKMEGKREQVIFYLAIMAVSALFAVYAFRFRMGYDWETSLRLAIVQSASAISTTGTQAADISLFWPPLAVVLTLLAVCGGMAGSTSGGLKTMRVIILVRNVRNILHNRLHPRAVNPVRLNGRPVAHSVINNVMVLFIVYAVVAFVASVLLMLIGEGGTESISAVMGCITGHGPRIGYTGELSVYSAYAPLSKWVCILVMLMGRLECLTVLVLLYPPFWKRR